MSIITQTFYHPLPRFGVPLKNQWDEFRENFNSLASIVRAAEVDQSNSPGQNDLSYLDVGELDFRNRFRVGYDKTNDRFVIEYNNGSEISPNWVPYFAIRQGDGRVIALGPGGFESQSGFYNLDTGGFYLVVRESAAGKRRLFDRGEAGVVFDSIFFYITDLSNPNEVFVTLTPSGSGGEANTATNLGAGTGVFSQKVGVDLRFRSLVAGTNTSLSSTASEITINSLAEINTASNVGSATGVFAQKSGVDLQFKSIRAGSNISISSDSSEITVNSTSLGFYGINVGETDGTPVYPRIQNLKFETSSFYVTQNNDRDTAIIAFRGSATGGGEANTASNVGLGTGLFAQKSGVDLQFKSLVAGRNISFASDSDEVTVNANTGGFYLTVAESDGSAFLRAFEKAKLTFNRSDFYLTPTLNNNEVMINLAVRPIQRYTHRESVGSREWIVNHSLNNTDVVFSTYDRRNKYLLPSSVDVSNPNTAFFYFFSVATGKAVIIG